MFGIDSSELFVIGLVALLVIGPSRLPMAMKTVGKWVAKGRAMTRHVRTGFDTMIREAELEEMQKAWAKHNEAIMKATASQPAAFPELTTAKTAPDVPALPESAAVMAEPPAKAAAAPAAQAEAPAGAAAEPAAKAPPPKRASRTRKKASDDA
jgi:sec-independent protein translocase protein TatB